MEQKYTYKPYLASVLKPTKVRMQSLRVKGTLLSTYVCSACEANSDYYFPGTKALKHAKKITFDMNVDTGEIVSRVLKLLKHVKPQKFFLNSQTVFKYIEKFSIFQHLDLFSNLKAFGVRMDGALFETKTAELVAHWILKAANIRTLHLSLEKISVSDEGLSKLIGKLEHLRYLENLIFKVPSANMTDVEFSEFADKSVAICKKLKKLVIEANANRTLGNEAMVSLGSALTNKTTIETFELNILGTAVGFHGLESVLNSLATNTKLSSFVLRANEVPRLDELLPSFFEHHAELVTVGLDFTNSSKIEEEVLRGIHDGVSGLPNLVKYTLNAGGCHALKGPGTIYLTGCIGLFTNIKHLKVTFCNFLEGLKHTVTCLDNIEENLARLTKLESLYLDFNNCTEWFENIKARPTTFLDRIQELTELRSLSLNIRKTMIDSSQIQRLQSSVLQLKKLKTFELDISFCQNIEDKDIRTLMMTLNSNLDLEEFVINADSVKYNQNNLSSDIQQILKNSKSIRRMSFTLKKNLTKKEGLQIVQNLEKLFPHIDLAIIGGRAFTVVKYPSNNAAMTGGRKSNFGSRHD